MPEKIAARRDQLESVLLDTQDLWRPATFRERRPPWCAEYPDLTRALLELDDRAVQFLSEDSEHSISWLSQHLPEIGRLAELIKLPGSAREPGAQEGKIHGVGARKVAQIGAFISALGKPRATAVEWCAGKGHLSRALLQAHGGEALAVEQNPELCRAGELLSGGLNHPFSQADVLAPATAGTLRGSHGIALHACGDLHVRLAEAAVEVGAPAIDFAPCCYQLTAREHYLPKSKASALSLDKNALKLAVTETTSSAPGRTARSERTSAWKLAFVNLREEIYPGASYRTFPPVPGHWGQLGFREFLCALAGREGIAIPEHFDFSRCEASGWLRHQESRRLQLVRLSYRRAIEIWLVCDLGCWLEQHGYAVGISEFCGRTITPRNLLVSARLGR